MSVPIPSHAPAGLAATTGPLAGVRILDFSRLPPGPWATQLLGALGADVVKVEQPVIGDLSQHNHPRYVPDSVYFNTVNANKRSAAIDLSGGTAAEVVPALIHCAIAGFGQTGPLSHIAGHALVIQAATGVLGCHPPSDNPPEVPGFQSADHAAALLSMCAIPLASAMSRPAPGLGEHSVAFLRETGFDEARIAQWVEAGAVAQLGGHG
jgi:crotonobetainyl-CoA:carnitine CoA-transferase CaiB-like acyl-CoA transferase